MTARMASSEATVSSAASVPCSRSKFIELSRSGRLSVMVATGPSTSKSTESVMATRTLRLGQRHQLEVHRVDDGRVVATPSEAPPLEDGHDLRIHVALRAPLVGRHVEVDGDAPGVERHRVAVLDELGHVATLVLLRMDLVGQAGTLDLGQRVAQRADHQP